MVLLIRSAAGGQNEIYKMPDQYPAALRRIAARKGRFAAVPGLHLPATLPYRPPPSSAISTSSRLSTSSAVPPWHRNLARAILQTLANFASRFPGVEANQLVRDLRQEEYRSGIRITDAAEWLAGLVA